MIQHRAPLRSAASRLVWLLMAPLLLAASVRSAAVPAVHTPFEGATLSSAATMGPALPGTATAAGTLGDAGSAPRAPLRTLDDPRLIEYPAPAVHARVAAIQRSRLDFPRAVDSARSVIPTTSGNPPPAFAA